jgi:hypothetical protein
LTARGLYHLMIGLLTVISKKARYRKDVSSLALLSFLVEVGTAALLLSNCLFLITVPTNSFLRTPTKELCRSKQFLKVAFLELKNFETQAFQDVSG